MTVLDTLYVSGGSRVIYNTLEITDGVTTFYLAESYEEITATLEDARVVTFQPCAMQVAMPARNADGTQDLQFAICNVDGQVSTQLQAAIASGRRGYVTYRQYIEGDLLAPASKPYTMVIKDGSWTALQADIRAGYMNILDTAWPRRLFTLNEFPGLRYL